MTDKSFHIFTFLSHPFKIIRLLHLHASARVLDEMGRVCVA